jgi:predicted Zn finger-like uncharacterized protein
MNLRCPSCGRVGNVPDHLGLTAHTVRCRRCRTVFSTVPARGNGESHQATSKTAPDISVSAPREFARVPYESFAMGSDNDLPAFAPRLPYDSQYEMTAVLGGDPDDSQTEMPAFTAGKTPSGETEDTPPFETAGAELFLPVPWYYSFIDSWGRLHFFVALGFAASSLSVLGFLLARALVGGHILSSSITALIVGCVGTVAFLLLSLSATALIVLLIDLARNVRQLIQQADRNLGGQVDAGAQNRSRLSQPIS